jgi:hypothetical protein
MLPTSTLSVTHAVMHHPHVKNHAEEDPLTGSEHEQKKAYVYRHHRCVGWNFHHSFPGV